MFDFERLTVYVKAKALNKKVQQFLRFKKGIDIYIKRQLRRSSLSMVLNIAEGSGRFSSKDKKHFYTVARGSTYECVSLFDLLKDEKMLEESYYQDFYSAFEEVSKILTALIRK